MEETEKERNQFRLVAHDLNNILLSTLHSVTLLKQKLEEGSSEYSLIKIIESNSNRASDILNDILNQSDKNKLNSRFVDISRLLNEVIIAFSPTLPREISIKTDIESHVDKAYCSRNDMYRVILNLLINAKEAINNGGTISATLKNFVSNKNLTIEKVGAVNFAELIIKDTGMGIDPDNLVKIFEPNFSTKEKNRISGLGLNIVKDLVENIGGKIFVKSELNIGTEFSVLIPTTESIASSRVDGKQKTILIAEDDLTLLKLLSELLESYNYNVLKSLDGNDVLEKLKNNKIDLIIIDKKMPKLDGLDCISTIRESGNQIPIILSSGSKSAVSDLIIDNLKIERVLNKPYDFEQMLSLIEGLIN